MELRKLDSSFYADNARVEQALDFHSESGTWDTGKVRGHGVVQISVHGLTFAIPVRSHIRHSASFILEVNRSDRRIKGMGLDYTKALLITNPSHISNDVFVLTTKNAGRKLIGKEQHITNHFQRYVERYIQAVQRADRNILGNTEYRYTTLINYHAELGITPGNTVELPMHD